MRGAADGIGFSQLSRTLAGRTSGLIGGCGSAAAGSGLAGCAAGCAGAGGSADIVTGAEGCASVLLAAAGDTLSVLAGAATCAAAVDVALGVAESGAVAAAVGSGFTLLAALASATRKLASLGSVEVWLSAFTVDAATGVGSEVHAACAWAFAGLPCAAADVVSAALAGAAAGCAAGCIAPAVCAPLVAGVGDAGARRCTVAPEASTEIKFEKIYPTCPLFVSIREKMNPYISTVKRSPQASVATVSCDRLGFVNTCVSSPCFEQST